jgi:tetratricopeptide (TPR) repeat protein
MSVRRVLLVLLLGFAATSRPAEAEPRAASSAAEPTDLATGEVGVWLAKLTGVDPAGRRDAALALGAATPAMLPGIARRLAELKRSANRDAMGAIVVRERKGSNGAGDNRASKTPSGSSDDWFERVLALPQPADGAWRDVVAILGMSRALVRIGSTPAVRELAGIYAAFGDVLRVDVERQMKVLGERAVATLIELRRSEAKPIRSWAAKMLDTLGKTVPGEAVQTADNQVLADVLYAYGRTKDTDAARVIVSFANSDRNQVREAAREAVTMLADSGIWQLRESYENLIGKKPPEEWGWEKVAGELFAAYDRSRLSEVHALMDEGVALQKSGKLEAMASAFDRVLARAPRFERRRDMVSGYIDFARSIEQSDRTRAMATLRRAVRIDPTGPRAREAESEVSYLEGVELASRGLVDETAYRRAVELDPNNRAAKDALYRLGVTSEGRSGGFLRYAMAALLALAAIACAAVGLVRARASW